MKRPCLTCGVLVDGASRCGEHARIVARQIESRRDRPHYRGSHRRAAEKIVKAASVCWLCGEGARAGDPWQADHVDPGVVGSQLLPAHRSCNIARSKATARA